MGNGVYGFAEVARLTGTRPQTVRSWFVGRGARVGAMLHSDYGPRRGRYAVSFLDLIDVLVVSAFRKQRISLQSLRQMHERLQDYLHSEHPFARNELMRLGSKLLLRTARDVDDVELIDLIDNQRFFTRGLEAVLERLDYDVDTKLAHRWRVAPGIVIDPTRAFGKPIVEEVGIVTHNLANAYLANCKDEGAVAAHYGIQRKHVRQAVKFETRLRAA